MHKTLRLVATGLVLNMTAAVAYAGSAPTPSLPGGSSLGQQSTAALATASALLIPIIASSQTTLFDRGNGMIYDSYSDVTWLADANLFKTQYAADPSIVDAIIENVGSIAGHTLTLTDFKGTTGGMSWWGAQAWVANLSYGGYDDWRLPTSSIVPGAQNPSELGHLFYVELEGIGMTIARAHSPEAIAAYQLFSNIGEARLWSSTSSSGTNGGYFDTVYGGGYNLKSTLFHAWAVRSGDVATVPIPGASWLFGTGFLGLLGSMRRRRTQ